MLEGELPRKLEEASVDGVALIGHRPGQRECVGAADICAGVARVAEARVIQYVERVGAELQVFALSPNLEVLEQ